jgi:hypothetical protein
VFLQMIVWGNLGISSPKFAATNSVRFNVND